MHFSRKSKVLLAGLLSTSPRGRPLPERVLPGTWKIPDCSRIDTGWYCTCLPWLIEICHQGIQWVSHGPEMGLKVHMIYFKHNEMPFCVMGASSTFNANMLLFENEQTLLKERVATARAFASICQILFLAQQTINALSYTTITQVRSLEPILWASSEMTFSGPCVPKVLLRRMLMYPDNGGNSMGWFGSSQIPSRSRKGL